MAKNEVLISGDLRRDLEARIEAPINLIEDGELFGSLWRTSLRVQGFREYDLRYHPDCRKGLPYVFVAACLTILTSAKNARGPPRSQLIGRSERSSVANNHPLGEETVTALRDVYNLAGACEVEEGLRQRYPEMRAMQREWALADASVRASCELIAPPLSERNGWNDRRFEAHAAHGSILCKITGSSEVLNPYYSGDYMSREATQTLISIWDSRVNANPSVSLGTSWWDTMVRYGVSKRL